MIMEGYFLFFLTEIICCDPSSEPSRRDGQMRSHNIDFSPALKKLPQINTKYSLLSRALLTDAKLL